MFDENERRQQIRFVARSCQFKSWLGGQESGSISSISFFARLSRVFSQFEKRHFLLLLVVVEGTVRVVRQQDPPKEEHQTSKGILLFQIITQQNNDCVTFTNPVIPKLKDTIDELFKNHRRTLQKNQIPPQGLEPWYPA
jgi:hypothetical protein